MTPQELSEKVGQQVGTSDWVEISQERIDRFAAATDDFQFIHVDPAKAAMTPFGGTIAHGFLTLSLIPLLREKSDVPRPDGVKMAVNYGGNKVRFLTPVRSGKRVRAHFKLLNLTEKRAGQWQETMETTLEIEGEDKPALIAEWISQFFI
jgi:acyl dehydratase